ncbi:MAG: hypothetical protein ACLPXM_05535 [Terriglobales bacterium]
MLAEALRPAAAIADPEIMLDEAFWYLALCASFSAPAGSGSLLDVDSEAVARSRSVAFNPGPSVHALAGGGSLLNACGRVVEKPVSLGSTAGASVHLLAGGGNFFNGGGEVVERPGVARLGVGWSVHALTCWCGAVVLISAGSRAGSRGETRMLAGIGCVWIIASGDICCG